MNERTWTYSIGTLEIEKVKLEEFLRRLTEKQALDKDADSARLIELTQGRIDNLREAIDMLKVADEQGLPF